MTATSTDRKCDHIAEGIESYPVYTATTIYNGSAVAVNASGYAVSLTDSAAVKFVGIAAEGVINTTAAGYGSSGQLSVKVYTRGVHAMVAAGLAVTDQGAELWWSDNQTVTKTPGTLYAGKLSRYTSATEALVDITPAIARTRRYFPLNLCVGGALGASTAMLDNFEWPKAVILRRAYASVAVAPGSGKNAVITITDGTTPKTLTVAGTATTAEDEAIDQFYAANTDLDISVAEDGATENLNVCFIFEEL